MAATMQPSTNATASWTRMARARFSETSPSFWKASCQNSGIKDLPPGRPSPRLPAQAVFRDGARAQSQGLYQLLERLWQCRTELELQDDLPRQQGPAVLPW